MIATARPFLYLVTDRARLARAGGDSLRALEAQLDAAVAAGIDVIQIRERDLEARPLEHLVAGVVSRAAGAPTRILVNDRADVAESAGAHGVHLRADGPDVGRVRARYPNLLIGRSIHTADDAIAHRDADYLLFGHVFATSSKPGQPAAGIAALREAVKAAAPCDVVAIGGIDASRARPCVSAGAAGVAAIDVFVPPALTDMRAYLARAIADLRVALQNC
ncbi:MAG TPA: thiamine phosphate synthase [Vicinamibacterales bacterium]|nr:thiamine phosphate synthase [Vicinamibacterales bacterium]